MKPKRQVTIVVLALAIVVGLHFISCSNEEQVDDLGDDDPNFPDGDGNCGEQDLELRLSGVKVMFLVNFSSSMTGGGKWGMATGAIEKMVTDPANKDTHFGLHVFPKPGMNPFNICSAAIAPAVEVGGGNGEHIVSWMNKNKPGMFSMTPLVAGLRYYLGATETSLHDPETANYLIVLSDGEDTCFQWDQTSQSAPYPSRITNMLTAITDDIKDVSNIKTIAIGFGNVNGNARNQLDAIARNGGTPFDEHIPAADGPALAAAFEEIAQSIRPCRYLVEQPETEFSSSKINFYFDGSKVSRDRKHEGGWDWTQNSELEVQFYGEACEQIRTGAVSKVSATFGCPTVIDGETCASSDSFLRFPGVSVMILLDSSGSMISPAKWKGATTAITNMIVDDRNNHVQFGLSAFPTGNQCSIAPSPEVSIGGSDSRLMIAEWLTRNMPSIVGGTPIVAGMQRLLNRPGGVEEKGVSGAVIVLTDGEDTCAGAKPISVSDQLADVTTELVDRHDVRVFAIGYKGGNVAQLNAIAGAGGTGLNSYQKAGDQAELEEVLKQISSMVTSCTFAVPYAGPDADYDEVNFYFDGDVVPKDAGQISGWSWVNDVTKTKVEFYGAYCDALKAGSVVDVVVEFGCETVAAI